MKSYLLPTLLGFSLLGAFGSTSCTADQCKNLGGDTDGDGICGNFDICAAGNDTVDTDHDGVPDACDVCPNDATLGKFNWVTWHTPISGTTATGTVGNTSITYTSSSTIQTIGSVFGYSNFPASFKVPNSDPTIMNTLVSTNTLTFERAISDPLLVFASVGHGGLPVPVQFSNPIVLEFQQGVSNVTDTAFTGEEGYAVVRIPGVHRSITFTYTAAESYANFVFGFGGTAADTDGDGTPDVCDVCPADNPNDTDGDSVCNSDDHCPGENDATSDNDHDGVCNSVDICSLGDDAIDTDHDGVPDACDPCPNDNPDDTDGDTVCDSADHCPGVDDMSATLGDVDGDGVCGSADICLTGSDHIDTDSDGTPNACDACPNDTTLATYNWITWDAPIDVHGQYASGTVGGISVSYSTNVYPIAVSTEMIGHAIFPNYFHVPNVDPTIKNTAVSTSSVYFMGNVTDPLFAFGSIGDAQHAVTIEFSAPIVVDFQSNITDITSNTITGNDGYAIVRMPSQQSNVTFHYSAADDYSNVAIGFGGTMEDTDQDGIADICDSCPTLAGTDANGCPPP